jgi:hypothetical protein
MKYQVLAIGLSIFAASNVSAQTGAVAEPAAMAVEAVKEAAMSAGMLSLSAGTEVTLTPNEDQTSKALRVGDKFIVSVMNDVTKDGIVVIPKGTPGSAAVTWRTGKGSFGKSAKMDITFESLTLANGKVLRLSGTHRQNGEGNTGATLGAVAAAGLIGGVFVTGKSAKIPHGMQLLARTAEAVDYEIPSDAKMTVQAKIIDPNMVTVPAEPAAVPPAN